ncbi:secretin N-terminal domain-containing protein [Ampullimonas aquatilis]|uniref:secretin N-terminal domain-containing protein n=1 Tax=Ampullimonas aquatilis TaxID=1341549 RepID=UPI003C737CDC
MLKDKFLTPLFCTFAFLILAGCAAGQKNIDNGKALLSKGKIEDGISELQKAVDLEPNNKDYRLLLLHQKELQVNGMLVKADEARMAEDYIEAKSVYERVLSIDKGNMRARLGLDAIETGKKQRALIDEADSLIAAGKNEEALARVRAVLAENPNHRDARALKRQLDENLSRAAQVPGLKAALKKLVNLEFRDANIKAVFEALSRSTGVNFVFDKDVKSDLKVTLFVNSISVEEVISVLTVTNQLEKKYLNDNTVLLYPNLPAKVKDYQELVIKTFYLSNAEAKQMMNMLKAITKTRDIFIDEKLNSVTIRDTPDAIKLAEKLIASQDFAEPEVVLEVEILEVKRSRLTEIGVAPPTQFTLLNIVQSPTTTAVSGSGLITQTTNPVTTTSQLTADKLKDLNSSKFGITNPAINVKSELGDTNLLANPRIRVKNREKAKILIGDKVPVITTTSTANVGVSESVNYLDVGLKLDVEPNVYLDDEVGIKVGLEVSNIVKEVKSNSGTLTYQIGTRAANTTLRLRDGETQALAGLINDEDRKTTTGWPGFTDVPILGRLFSSERSDRSKTEIVLLITPHIVRNIVNKFATPLEYSSGTESSVGAIPLSLRTSGRLTSPPAGRGGQQGQTPQNGSVPGNGPAQVQEVPAVEPAAAPPVNANPGEPVVAPAGANPDEINK